MIVKIYQEPLSWSPINGREVSESAAKAAWMKALRARCMMAAPLERQPLKPGSFDQAAGFSLPKRLTISGDKE